MSRIFFAFWPDARIVRQLAQLQAELSLGGKRVAPENLHITLAFIGEVDSDALGQYRQIGREMLFEPFDIALDTLGYFRKPRIAWIGPSQVPQAMFSAHERLVQLLAKRGYAAEPRPYRPHLTLARKALARKALTRKAEAAPDIPIDPIHWTVENFVLVESKSAEQGVHYSVLERYAPANPLSPVSAVRAEL